MSVSLKQYQQKIELSQSTLIIYGERSKFPAVAAATSLYLWLKSLSKKVCLASPQPPLVEFCHLIGINKVKTQLPKENLVITLPYNESKIDKVISDLNSEKTELSLIVKPKKGELPLKTQDLKISYQIADFDLIIMIDVRSHKELTKLADSKIHPWNNPQKIITCNSFANPNPVTASISDVLNKNTNFCTFYGNLLRLNDVTISEDIASNLLMGLENETQNFHSDGNADIFELAAWLTRCGGHRYRADQTPANSLPPLPLDSHPPDSSLSQTLIPPLPSTPPKKTSPNDRSTSPPHFSRHFPPSSSSHSPNT
jgi:nanoRNase/pAp phosphatase (c-di-AMP/oligoRNAs hydrolase)